MNYLAIDLGGTKIKYALMNEDADILEKGKDDTPPGTTATIDDLLEVLDTIISKYRADIEGIALSLPGILDSDTGQSITSGALHYLSGSNLSKILQEKYDLLVTVENDGKSAALAELWKGSLKGIKNGAVVLLGTGVGGGIIIDGKLYKGNNFAAGELSFMIFNPTTTQLWAETGGTPYLLKLVSEKTNISTHELDGYKIFEMAHANNKEVLAALNEYTYGIACQLYSLQAVLDLDIFAIGGGISRQSLLLEYLQKNIDKIEEEHPLKGIMPYIPVPRITNCHYFNDSNLIGALYHHLQVAKLKNY